MSKSMKIAAVVTLGLAMLLLLGAFPGRTVYRGLKEKRCLNRARAYAEKGDHRNALLSLRMALSINPSNGTAAVLIADVLDKGHSPEALIWRRRTAEFDPTLTNKLTFAACALRYEKPPYVSAAATLQGLAAEAQTNLVYHLLSVQMALALNHSAEAEEHLRALIRLDPGNPRHALNLATIHLQSEEATVADRAREELVALAHEPAVGLTALRSLASEALTRKDFAGAHEFGLRLIAQPSATLEDRLLQLKTLKEANAAEFEAGLVSMQRESVTNPATVAKVITWMTGEGMGKEALEWNSRLPASAREAMPVRIAGAHSYMAAGDFKGLMAHLFAREWGEQEFLRQAFLARAFREQGESASSNLYWRLARRAADSDPARVSLMLYLTQTWGWRHEFRELLWLAAGRAYRQDWPLQRLLEEYLQQNDTEGLYRVYGSMLARNRQSVEYKNNVAALGLLLRTNIPHAVELARESYDAVPTNSTVISTYAFALHTQGKTSDALRLMEALPPFELQRADVALYYGVLLAASGQAAKALPFLQAAEKRKPLPEEARLLEQARAAAAAVQPQT